VGAILPAQDARAVTANCDEDDIGHIGDSGAWPPYDHIQDHNHGGGEEPWPGPLQHGEGVCVHGLSWFSFASRFCSISWHSATHSLQMKMGPGPAMRLATSSCALPQKLQ
jgi:hypothetical protein